MATSKIIAEFAGGEINIENTLKRIIVLTSKFEDKKITLWAQNEIGGYDDNTDVPKYRVLEGIIMGSYQIWGGGILQTHSNKRLPTIGLTEDQLVTICTKKFKNGVLGLRGFLGVTGCIYPLPMESYYLFEKDTNIQVINAHISYSGGQMQNILSKIDVVTLNVLIELEKNFGLLDSLDVSLESKSKNEQNQIAQTLISIIYNDNKIEIGDNNKMVRTNILSGISERLKRKK